MLDFSGAPSQLKALRLTSNTVQIQIQHSHPCRVPVASGCCMRSLALGLVGFPVLKYGEEVDGETISRPSYKAIGRILNKLAETVKSKWFEVKDLSQ